MRRFLCVLAVLTAATAVSTAQAGNYPSPTLDAAASSIAGRPISVWCETSESAWQSYLPPGVDAAGFWTPALPNQVQIAPSECLTLVNYLTLRRVDEVGVYSLAFSLFTLVHESVHARLYGGDEGLVDCTAMPLVPGVATSFFGIPATVVQTTYQTVRRSVRVRVKRHTYVRWYTTTVPVSQTIANPDLARLSAWLPVIHRAKPPAYQGTC